jgi:hypothetical protein
MLNEEPKKLIVSRRAIAAGLAALVGGTPSVAALERLSNVPLTFDPSEFSGEMRDGLFLPDYRYPMCRIVFADGSTTGWNRYTMAGKKCHSGNVDRWMNPKAIEVCAPDKNGMPRYTQLAIG